MALVITRNVNECILIGDNIRIEIVRINTQSGVRLAISAPPSVKILREELISFKEAEEFKERCNQA